MIEFGVLHSSGLGLVPVCGPTPLVSGQAVAATHIQKEDDWQQMLAQGQSSSVKKKKGVSLVSLFLLNVAIYLCVSSCSYF